MLRAEQLALEQQGRSDWLRILEREFSYYKDSFEAVGTQAALIAGFTVAVLVTIELENDDRYWRTLFHISSFVSLLMLIYCVVIVTLLLVCGPNLALRGNSPTAMEKALRAIKRERFLIYASFFAGVFSFMVMVYCCAWILMTHLTAQLCSGLLVVVCTILVLQGWRIYSEFKVVEVPAGSPSVRAMSEADRSSTGSVVGGMHIRHGSKHSFTNFSSSLSGTHATNDGHTHGVAASARPKASAAADRGSSMTAPLIHKSSESGGGGNRESSGSDAARDELVALLVSAGGGWLWKKRGGMSSAGWKKRWVGVDGSVGVLWYSKSKFACPHDGSKPGNDDAKDVDLKGLDLMVANDERTFRLVDSNDRTGAGRLVDWRALVPEDREGWVQYLRVGIGSANQRKGSPTIMPSHANTAL